MPIERSATWKRGPRRCHYCLVTLRPGTATLDHVTARANGGTNSQNRNCVLSCWPCNRRKGHLSAAEFEAQPWLADRRRRVASGRVGHAPVVPGKRR